MIYINHEKSNTAAENWSLLEIWELRKLWLAFEGLKQSNRWVVIIPTYNGLLGCGYNYKETSYANIFSTER